MSLYSSKSESGNVGTCANAHDALVGDLVLDQCSDCVGQQSDNDHGQHVHTSHEGVVAKLFLEVERYPEGKHREAEKAE